MKKAFAVVLGIVLSALCIYNFAGIFEMIKDWLDTGLNPYVIAMFFIIGVAIIARFVKVEEKPKPVPQAPGQPPPQEKSEEKSQELSTGGLTRGRKRK